MWNMFYVCLLWSIHPDLLPTWALTKLYIIVSCVPPLGHLQYNKVFSMVCNTEAGSADTEGNWIYQHNGQLLFFPRAHICREVTALCTIHKFLKLSLRSSYWGLCCSICHLCIVSALKKHYEDKSSCLLCYYSVHVEHGRPFSWASPQQ